MLGDEKRKLEGRRRCFRITKVTRSLVYFFRLKGMFVKAKTIDFCFQVI